MTRILVVCLGNICRSPTAEVVLRGLAAAEDVPVEVDSAGTGDWHIGDPPYGPAIAAGRARGYDLTPLRARQVTKTDFDAFDLILAMDRKNLATLNAMAPPNTRAGVQLYIEDNDVPDPYYTRDFDGALDLIETGARRAIDQLRQNASAAWPKF